MCTHVILCKVRVVVLYAIVKDANDNSFTSVAFLPGRQHIHVEASTGAFVQVPLLAVQGVREPAAQDTITRTLQYTKIYLVKT